jgi:hypothetical protein
VAEGKSGKRDLTAKGAKDATLGYEEQDSRQDLICDLERSGRIDIYIKSLLNRKLNLIQPMLVKKADG